MSRRGISRRMPGNPKGSKWRSTPQAARKRKTVLVTLSDEARARLVALAGMDDTKSAVVERLISEAGRSDVDLRIELGAARVARDCYKDLADRLESESDEWRDKALRLVTKYAPLVAVLRAVEWQDRDVVPYCPSCYGYKDNGHAVDCALDSALRTAPIGARE